MAQVQASCIPDALRPVCISEIFANIFSHLSVYDQYSFAGTTTEIYRALNTFRANNWSAHGMALCSYDVTLAHKLLNEILNQPAGLSIWQKNIYCPFDPESIIAAICKFNQHFTLIVSCGYKRVNYWAKLLNGHVSTDSILINKINVINISNLRKINPYLPENVVVMIDMTNSISSTIPMIYNVPLIAFHNTPKLHYDIIPKHRQLPVPTFRYEYVPELPDTARAGKLYVFSVDNIGIKLLNMQRIQSIGSFNAHLGQGVYYENNEQICDEISVDAIVFVPPKIYTICYHLNTFVNNLQRVRSTHPEVTIYVIGSDYDTICHKINLHNMSWKAYSVDYLYIIHHFIVICRLLGISVGDLTAPDVSLFNGLISIKNLNVRQFIFDEWNSKPSAFSAAQKRIVLHL